MARNEYSDEELELFLFESVGGEHLTTGHCFTINSTCQPSADGEQLKNGKLVISLHVSVLY